jgi:hypothetical protein
MVPAGPHSSKQIWLDCFSVLAHSLQTVQPSRLCCWHTACLMLFCAVPVDVVYTVVQRDPVNMLISALTGNCNASISFTFDLICRTQAGGCCLRGHIVSDGTVRQAG